MNTSKGKSEWMKDYIRKLKTIKLLHQVSLKNKWEFLSKMRNLMKQGKTKMSLLGFSEVRGM
jgi:ABC-type antimicrobial peptide transport system ATPase subunit